MIRNYFVFGNNKKSKVITKLSVTIVNVNVLWLNVFESSQSVSFLHYCKRIVTPLLRIIELIRMNLTHIVKFNRRYILSSLIL